MQTGGKRWAFSKYWELNEEINRMNDAGNPIGGSKIQVMVRKEYGNQENTEAEATSGNPAQAPLVLWKNHGQKAEFIGGKQLKDLSTVTDESYLDRIHANHRKFIYKRRSCKMVLIGHARPRIGAGRDGATLMKENACCDVYS